MKKNSLIDYIPVMLIRLYGWFVRLLPLSLALFLGRVLGRGVYYFSPKRASIAYSNIRSAMPETPLNETRHVVRQVYAMLGMNTIETLRIPRLDASYLDRYTTIEGADHIDQVLRDEGGAVFLTGHFGNWELLAAVAGLLGYPLSVVARAQGSAVMNEFITMYREHTGIEIIHKGGATKKISQALRANRLVGLLVDQDGGKNGIFADLFNRPASTAQAGLLLALKSKVPVLPAFIMRVGTTSHKIMVYPPFRYDAEGDIIANAVTIIKQFNLLLEGYVKEHPAQWLWGHRRWKSTTLRKVVMLDDGKAGHRNQSQAVMHHLHQALARRGMRVVGEAISIAYKTPLRRWLVSRFSASLLMQNYCLRQRCMQWALMPDSWDRLKCAYADCVISAGNSTIAANLFLKYESGAKNAVCMNPRRWPRKLFTAIIVPRHDNLTSGKNIFITTGSPHAVTAIARAEAVERLTAQGVIRPVDMTICRLGLLLGGASKKYDVSVSTVQMLLDEFMRLREHHEYHLLATTSRRTSPAVEAMIEVSLRDKDWVRLLVCAHTDNPAGVVPAIIDLSQVVIVTAESISMISEAASSGRAVLVLRQEGEKLSPRHRRFLEELETKKYIHSFYAHETASVLRSWCDGNLTTRQLDDADILRAAVERLI